MKSPNYRHYYLRIEKMKKNELCYFFLIWLLSLFFILAISNLGPTKLSEETLTKSCQKDLSIKNYTEEEKLSSLRCFYCHKNFHHNIKKFTYIATILPLEDKIHENFANYVLKGRISVFQKENTNASCKDLLQYTTWEDFPAINHSKNFETSGYKSLVSQQNFKSSLKCFTFSNDIYMCETQGLFTSNENGDKSRAFFFELNNESLLDNFSDHAFFSFVFEKPEYVNFIFIFKGVFCIVTIFFFYIVKKKLSYLRMQDWLSVHQCFFILLIAQIIYNDPLGIINILWFNNDTIDLISEIIELLFYNFLMMLWLGLFESALKESNRRRIYILKFLKFIMPVCLFILSSIWKIQIWMQQSTNPRETTTEESILFLNLKVCLYGSFGIYAFYFFILAMQHTYLVIKKEEGLTDYKYLCIFSEIIFLLLVGCLTLTLSVPRNYSAFYSISFHALINLYLFGVYILYSPADYREVTELRIKEKEEIMKEVYGEETHEFPEKSMELHDMENNPLGDYFHEETKKKAWEQIQKSTESEPDLHKEDEDDDKYIYS